MTMIPIASSTVGTGGATTITFNNIPQTFTHLQVRVFARTSTANWVTATFNNDTAAGRYRDHFLYGQGTNAISGTNGNNNSMFWGPYLGATTSNVFGVCIADILDYTNTNKNKTVRTLWGYENNNVGGDQVWLQSQLYLTTSAITRIDLSLTTFQQHSRVDLYGITDSPRTGA